MDREYKAFISYRHLPLEMDVAKKIHRRIEHYLIPAALRKDGKKHPGLVFRDQDELPISGSLSENIQLALDHAEFLIVICTPETSKSRWVLREIEYFLQHHDRDHVLVVLADGTPESAFPAQLTEERDENGALTARFEPLAANIVADSAARRNRLLRTESLRILAALIGCPYDALYRREQRYRMRRLGAAAAAVALIAAAFIGMLLNRNAEIRRSYMQTLRGQSVYLAAESQISLTEGDRMRAIALAMAALPEKEGERPLVSRAEYALGRAVGVYRSPGGSSFAATGLLRHGSQVTDMLLSEGEDTLLTMTENHVVTAWDTGNLQKRWSFPTGQDYNCGLGCLLDAGLCLWSGDRIWCLDLETGAAVWEKSAADCSGRNWDTVHHLFAAPDGEVLALADSGILRLDGNSGDLLSFTPEPDTVGETRVLFDWTKAALSPDGKLLAVSAEQSGGKGIAVFDLESGQTVLIPAEKGKYIYLSKCMLLSEDGRLYYITADLTAGEGSFGAGIYQNMQRDCFVLHCADARSGETLWQSEHRGSGGGYSERLSVEKDLMDRPVLLFSFADHMDVVDAETGETLGETMHDGRVIRALAYEGSIYCFTNTGAVALIHPEDFSSWFSAQLFDRNVDQCLGSPGCYWIREVSADRVIQFGWQSSDPAWLSIPCDFEGERVSSSPDDVFTGEDIFALVDADRLFFHTGGAEQAFHMLPLPRTESGYGSFRFLDCRDGVLRLSLSGEGDCRLLLADPAAGSLRTVDWAEPRLHPLLLDAAADGTLFALAEEVNEEDPYAEHPAVLCVLDEALNIRSELPLGSIAHTAPDDYCADDGSVYVYLPEEGKSLRVDLQKGTAETCAPEMTEAFASAAQSGRPLRESVSMSRDGKLLAVTTAGSRVELLGRDGSSQGALRCQTDRVISAFFSDDGKQIYTVESDSFLHSYSIPDGSELGKTELGQAIGNNADVCWSETSRGFLTVRIKGDLYLISREDGECFACVPFCYGYQESTDLFFCPDDSADGTPFGGFYRHTTESLMAMGRDELKGWELEISDRQRYGLELP